MQHDDSADLWMVVAFIQPFKLDAVALALEEVDGFGGMTVSDCRGFGHEKLAPDLSTGEHPAQQPQANRRQADAGFLDFKAKVRVEIAVAGRAVADEVVGALARTARTGRRGDGKILVWPVAHAVRVRTSEVDDAAL